MDKTILVTVGTTRFDALIHRIYSRDFAKAMKELRYTRIIIQYGKIDKECNEEYFVEQGIEVESFPYCSSLTNYYKSVQMVIGHAGAGTILESLRNRLKLIVVANDSLADNHQHEIADILEQDKYLLTATVQSLVDVLYKSEHFSQQVYPDAHPELFCSFLDKQLRFF